MQIDLKILLLCLFVSCWNTAGEISEPLKKSEGFAVLLIEVSGRVPKMVKLEGASVLSRNYRMKSLKVGQNFEIVRLPAGEYLWSRVNVTDRYFFRIEDLDFKLTVKSGVINYGGHFIMNINSLYGTAKFNYVNRSSLIIDELERCCKKLTNSHELFFSGKSADPFIQFYKIALENERD